MDDNIDATLLIPAVECFPEIWDKTADVYSDRIKKRDAWRMVCAQLCPEFDNIDEDDKDDVVKSMTRKWNNIRDQWIKWKRKEKMYGSNRKYIYHDHLKFLDKVHMQNAIKKEGGEEQLQHVEDSETYGESGSETMQSRRSLGHDDLHNSAQGKKRKRKFEEVLLEMDQTQLGPGQESRHMLFFRSIAPSLEMFNEDQILDFQLGVLQTLKNVRNGLPAIQTFNQPCCGHSVHDQDQPNPVYPEVVLETRSGDAHRYRRTPPSSTHSDEDT
uniref:Transcription factor Adf-1 n=2 Tax=Lygus hesperus TaxID=30085 RepID=A0A0A9WD81_LYGHE